MKSLCSTLAAAVLFGSSTASQLRNRLTNTTPVLDFAEAESGSGVAHTCQFAINRINNEKNTDYKKIIDVGNAFTDVDFPANSEMIRWSDYPGRTSMSSYATASKYLRIPTKVNQPALFTSKVDSFDIVQGQDADCYWITATSDVAHTNRMRDVFLTQNFNKAGIQAVKLYVRGLPTIVVVDDYVPYYNGNLIMNRQPPDGDYWAIVLEKAWAKVNGNYENINYGW